MTGTGEALAVGLKVGLTVVRRGGGALDNLMNY